MYGLCKGTVLVQALASLQGRCWLQLWAATLQLT